MCYVCRRVYHDMEGWDGEWESDDAPPPTYAQLLTIPCTSLVLILDECFLALTGVGPSLRAASRKESPESPEGSRRPT